MKRHDSPRAEAELCLHSRLLAALDEAVVATEIDGTITYWNDAAERLYGWRMEEVVDRNIVHVMSVDTTPTQAGAITARLSTEWGWSGEFVGRRKDGAVVVADVSNTPVLDETGRLIGVVGIFRDVTDRREREPAVVGCARTVPVEPRHTDLDMTELRQVEKGLQAAELRFRSGFEQSPIGLALSSPEGRYMVVNPALCELLGRSEADLREMTFAQVSHPDDAARDLTAARRMLSGETQTYQTEKRYLRSDGEVVWASLSTSLVRDDEGCPDYFFGQVQDITERRRAEQGARAVAELGRSALSGTTAELLVDEAVAAVASCLSVECAAVLLRRPSDELMVAAEVGGPCGPVGSHVGPGDDSYARYTIAGGEAVVADLGTETRFVPSPRLVERGLVGSLSVVITVHGRAYGVLSGHSKEARRFSAADVHFVEAVANVVGMAIERSHHDQQERLAVVGQLAAGVAHDFNNIVSAISLFAELLGRQSDFDEAGRAHLGAIGQQVERATALVWQVLDFAHRRPLEAVEVDLGSFLAGLLPVLRRSLPDKVALAVADDGRSHLVRGDPTRLQQILTNLATNARDAIDDHGELTITLSRGGGPRTAATAPAPDDSWVRVDVADTGAGMSSEVVERVFEPFFTTKPPGQGTGLGLAQVHGLVSQHGGHIEIDSSVGVGTTVSIWLRAAVRGAVAKGVERPEVLRGTGERLLVVDDDDAVRSALGQVLEALGYAVTLAADGDEALTHLDLEANSVSAVVSDVMMPGIGGEGLARAVAERWPNIPVVLISGNPVPRPRTGRLASVPVAGEKEGGVIRLSKPFSSNELAETLRATLGPSS